MFYIGSRGCVLCQLIEPVTFARCAFIFALRNIASHLRRSCPNYIGTVPGCSIYAAPTMYSYPKESSVPPINGPPQLYRGCPGDGLKGGRPGQNNYYMPQSVA